MLFPLSILDIQQNSCCCKYATQKQHKLRNEKRMVEFQSLPPKKQQKGIPFDIEEEVTGKDRDRPPINQAQNPMHNAEIQKERERIYNELKKQDQKTRHQ